MQIIVQTEIKGFMSASMNRISLQVIKFVDETGKELGILSGDQLNQQLKHQGFEIKDYKVQ